MVDSLPNYIELFDVRVSFKFKSLWLQDPRFLYYAILDLNKVMDQYR